MNDIIFSPFSMLDDFGRVFFMNGKVFRAISPLFIDQCENLLKEPFFNELMKEGLIPKTHKADFILPGHNIILEHEKLLNTLQYEWTFSMFKNAALTILKIQNICEKYGYELKDAHSMNILFRGNQAVYVDIGSFQKKQQNEWIAYREFIFCFYIPLCFWSEGKFYITRKLLESNFYRMQTIPEQNILNSGLIELIKDKPFFYSLVIRNKKRLTTSLELKPLHLFTKVFNKVISILRKRQSKTAVYYRAYKDIKEINTKIEQMAFPRSASIWKGYHSKFYSKNGKLSTSTRFDKIIDILQKIDAADTINSTLDLAGNEGMLSFLIKEKLNISTVNLSDYDENALEKAYEEQARLKSDLNIILLNFMFTPNIEYSAKRLKSDVVLALAVTHHLILTSNYLLSTILERISSYSNKYVMIEFMPKGLWSIEDQKETNTPEWYNIDWFKDEFIKHFNLLRIDELEQNRILFVGEKR